ncbi:MAG: SCO family protein [Pseudomonadota bacterium]
MTRAILYASSGVAAAILGVGGWLVYEGQSVDRFAECRNTTVALSGSDIGGPFSLISETGDAVTDADVIDGLTMVYFGYTYCPDVCPLDAGRNAEAADLAQAQGVTMSTLFITIDPERDTPEELANFTDYLHDDMIGLTGTPEALEAARKSYHVYAAKNGEGEDYLMDHSNYSYLMHSDHGFLALIRHNETAEQVAQTALCMSERI